MSRTVPGGEVEISGYYPLVKKLVAQLGGTMEFQPGGAGGGGAWVLTLHQRTARVPFRDRACALDELYEFEGKDAPLRADGFWRLIALFESHA